ncbi:pentatricopeptide repeat-containing protein At2g20710, mitochondrial-like [Solanum verrucosum]|uniref:pentatricopeptide repeat-containing protein At2g20710, mitochondrial-like n=1 Tax=Solanum verrucosum TaxID=315347 RepID=UPI0020D1533E|nr:pentatricopeptide repeat-containing protein At2g20710, mitochondrial-like [Solanum verrucosum]
MVKLVQQSWWKFSTCFLRVSSSYSTIAETIASLDLTNEDEQGSNPLTSSPKDALYLVNLHVLQIFQLYQFNVDLTRAISKFARIMKSIFEWIKKSKDFDISPRDLAVELDLVSKAHGLEAAEQDTMQKLKELGYAGTLAYNVMMTLYAKLGYLEKLQSLVLEMEDNGISGNLISYNIRLNVYASVPNVAEMEKVLMKMEADPLLIDWSSYAIAAKGYLKLVI